MDTRGLISRSLILGLFFLISVSTNGQNNFDRIPPNVSSTLFNINDISTWIYNNGISDHKAPENKPGFEYPKGSGKTAVFITGFIWAGKVDGQIRIGGSDYRSGLQPGKIFESGEAEDPSNAKIYRVRKDWKTANLSDDIEKLGLTGTEVREQYRLNWQNWPVDDGAPFDDIDNDGNYNPETDIPGIPGAHQTIWYVSNDFSELVTQNFYTSQPTGIELQTTIWGYNTDDYLNNIIFRKYRLINKGNNNIEEMYVSIWSDCDIGKADDDLCGADSSLDLCYTYNGKYNDEQYELAPPAVGFCYYQGPIAKSNNSDSAMFNNTFRKGYKNLKTYAHFVEFPQWQDEMRPDEYIPVEWYNKIRGRFPSTGELFTGPKPYNDRTKFLYWGDPVYSEGWLDTTFRDKQNGLSSGPFNMSPGDTQEVVIAQIASGGKDNVDRTMAVGLLRLESQYGKLFYQNSCIEKSYPDFPSKKSETVIPDNFSLKQNYPNPFNPSTIIEFSVPTNSFVQLKVYNILGKEIASLVNKQLNAGNYTALFEASYLPSGVYIYRMTTNLYSASKKMILQK